MSKHNPKWGHDFQLQSAHEGSDQFGTNALKPGNEVMI